jgi:hypothetical protein
MSSLHHLVIDHFPLTLHIMEIRLRFSDHRWLPHRLPQNRAVIVQSVQRLAGGLWFDFRQGLGIFLFTTASRTALRSTQPPIQWVWGALSLGVKRPGCEADHSPPSSAEVKEWVDLYLHFPNTPSWRGVQLRKKHMNNFTFTFACLTITEMLQYCDFSMPMLPGASSDTFLFVTASRPALGSTKAFYPMDTVVYFPRG